MKALPVCLLSLFCGGIAAMAGSSAVLQADKFAHFVESFNRNGRERHPGTIANPGAWDGMQKSVPLFDGSGTTGATAPWKQSVS